MRIKIFALIIIGLTLFSVGCQDISVYNATIDIPNESWNVDSLATFNVEIADTSTIHNIFVNIRNTNRFPNSNLFLFIHTTSPSGSTLRDTMECILADERGNWLGKGFGAISDSQIPYKKYIRFPEMGTYTISLQHGMRTSNLIGIASVGIKVEKVKD